MTSYHKPLRSPVLSFFPLYLFIFTFILLRWLSNLIKSCLCLTPSRCGSGAISVLLLIDLEYNANVHLCGMRNKISVNLYRISMDIKLLEKYSWMNFYFCKWDHFVNSWNDSFEMVWTLRCQRPRLACLINCYSINFKTIPLCMWSVWQMSVKLPLWAWNILDARGAKMAKTEPQLLRVLPSN